MMSEQKLSERLRELGEQEYHSAHYFELADRAAALEAELALRDKLQDTTAQLRADCGKMAQARDAAVNLLVELGAELRDKAFDKRFLPSSTRDVIAQTIALLSGPGEDDESFPDVV